MLATIVQRTMVCIGINDLLHGRELGSVRFPYLSVSLGLPFLFDFRR